MLRLDCFFLYYFETLKKDSSCTLLRKGETSKYSKVVQQLKSDLILLTAKLEKIQQKHSTVLVSPFISTTEDRVRLIFKYLKTTIFLKDESVSIAKFYDVLILHTQDLVNYYSSNSILNTPQDHLNFLLNIITIVHVISKLSFHLFLQQNDSHYLFNIIYLTKHFVLDSFDWLLFLLGESFSQKENFSHVQLLLSHLFSKYCIALYLFYFPTLPQDYALENVLKKMPNLIDELVFWKYLQFMCFHRNDLSEKDKILEISRNKSKKNFLEFLTRADLAKLENNCNIIKKLYFDTNQIVKSTLKESLFAKLIHSLTFKMETTLQQEKTRFLSTKENKESAEFLFHFGSIERNKNPSPLVMQLCDLFCVKYIDQVLRKHFSLHLKSYFHFLTSQGIEVDDYHEQQEELHLCNDTNHTWSDESQEQSDEEENIVNTVNLCSSQEEEEEPVITRKRRRL